MGTPSTLDASLIREQWYYSIELEPGLYTKGHLHQNVALTRDLLAKTHVQGARCLDVGIMEGLVSCLLVRRGAASVIGYDRLGGLADRVELVKRALGARFDTLFGLRFDQLPAHLWQTGKRPFDIVVFSGVLYHMFDPMGGLAIARSTVRDGGIIIIETACALESAMGMYFNAKASIYRTLDPTNYWFMTPRCLDYLLRFLRLRPLDCVYRVQAACPAGLRVGRIAIACRAESDPLPEADDEWMDAPRLRDYDGLIEWGRTKSADPPVPYRAPVDGLVLREDNGCVDLEATVAATRPLQIGEDQLHLALDQVY